MTGMLSKLKPSNDFSEKMQSKEYGDDRYPYSKIGYKVHTIMILILKIFIIFEVIRFCLFIATLYLDYDFIKTMHSYNMMILTFVTRLFIISVVTYLVLVFMRSRNHERSIMVNDFRTRLLRHSLRKRVNFKQHHKELSRKMSDAKSQDKENKKRKSKSSGPSIDDRNTLKALKALIKIKVFVNTRKQLDDQSQLSTQAKAIINLPKDIGVQNKIKDMTQNLDEDLSASSAGRFTFGHFFFTKDYKQVISRAWSSKKDKYYVPPVPKGEENLPKVTESTYSLDVFPDNTEINAQIAYSADKWAETMAKKVSEALNNSKIKCEYEYANINSMLATLNFRIAEDNETVNVDNIPKLLQQYLGKNKVTADSDGNYIRVTIPLQKEHQTQMDMPTLFKAAFNHKDYQ